ncbi:MAG: prepilin-type N-terminal cleavage/methylation domain-containing protein [Opitutaceae bacterium]|nr:prepilin-type N-terminal cleavage/methylation domain-containing protein [Opitutaceae bacterium]
MTGIAAPPPRTPAQRSSVFGIPNLGGTLRPGSTGSPPAEAFGEGCVPPATALESAGTLLTDACGKTWSPPTTRRSGPEARAPRSAFSLIEVVAAIAIFAIGMVAVLGLFAPVTKSVATVTDAESAARVADAIRSRIDVMPFESALVLIQTPANVRKNDGDPAYNPNDGTKHPYVLFAKLSGEAGVYDSADTRKNWRDSSDRVVADRDKFFEIDLIRNEALSPADSDPLASVVAYTIRVRWPAFQPIAGGGSVQVGRSSTGGGPVPFDHSRKQVLFFTGVLRR